VILENEFTVAADAETVWRHLLDIERVAGCLPGASISAAGADGVYEGSMRLKIGPMRVEYRGRAKLSEIDEDARTAVIELSAREAKGQGTAMATIFNRLEEVDGATRVRARTELNITGPQAQFGRGVIEDVGRRVMDEFSRRLEAQIAGEDLAADQPPPASAPDAGPLGSTAQQGPPPPGGFDAPASAAGDDVLDVGELIPAKLKLAGAGLALATAVALLLRLRRHSGRGSAG
jgi:carbon monoxide dehydrogenase subunit G